MKDSFEYQDPQGSYDDAFQYWSPSAFENPHEDGCVDPQLLIQSRSNSPAEEYGTSIEPSPDDTTTYPEESQYDDPSMWFEPVDPYPCIPDFEAILVQADPESISPPDQDIPIEVEDPNCKVTEMSKEDSIKLLLEMRAQGYSYKEILKMPPFIGVPESTLRGRHRTAIKGPNERQRDPKWTEIDDHLLREAVELFFSDPYDINNMCRKTNAPWKEAGEYIRSRGGTYTYSPPTCHKHWREIIGADRVQKCKGHRPSKTVRNRPKTSKKLHRLVQHGDIAA